MDRRLAYPFLLSASFALAGCPDAGGRDEDMRKAQPDLVFVFPDDGGTDEDMGPGELNVCGDKDPQCQEWSIGPDNNKPFPLPTDPNKDPNAASDGIGRNPNGWLVLDQTQASFQYIWLAQDSAGTVAKVDSRTMKEIARYSTVTCFSLATGSTQQCDGKNGCCASDSLPQWENRKAKQPEGMAQAVQRNSNSPSRTAVDFNGDLFVANRSFGGQASITKIANNLGSCKDRNKNGKIDTSVDANKDGRIDPNDPKEFFGVEDECILWTANHGTIGSTGRPLGLGPGSIDSGPSDAWAGGYDTGRFFRIDGTTGKAKAEAQLPNGCEPYGLAVDSQGIGWSPDLGGGKLCYFDTKNPQNVGAARDPQWGEMSGYGITLDRDQNVWVGFEPARYTPDRSKGFAGLGNGYWTRIGDLNGIGIAADSRTPKKYFVWSANGSEIVRIPASDIPLPKGQDVTVPGNEVAQYKRINVESYGVGIDADQNVIAAPQGNAVYRAKVDMNGEPSDPVLGPPKQGEQCPAGDSCDLDTNQYTYSDFTGFGLRNFTRPTGTYSYVIKGCSEENTPRPTQWFTIVYDADVPPNTTLVVRARSGSTDKPDQTWGQWTIDFNMSPVDLSLKGVLEPNRPDSEDAKFLQVEFSFKTQDRAASPKLKSFKVGYKCNTGPG